MEESQEYVTQKELYDEIRRDIDEIVQFGKNSDCTREQLEECMKRIFAKRSSSYGERLLFFGIRCFKVLICLFITAVCVSVAISCHNPTKKIISRHVQPLIYPFMRILRLWTLPIMQAYDASHWYQTTCLAPNPFFKVPVAECWACDSVRYVPDLSGLTNFTDFYYQNGIPFVIKDAMAEEVPFRILREMYNGNQHSFEKGPVTFKSNQRKFTSPSGLFQTSSESEEINDPHLHVEWGVYKVSAVQVLRKRFRRPYFIPNRTEVALQKFIFVDGPSSLPYSFPVTDFANVWITQGSGQRVIFLEPSPECKKLCSSLSVLLRPRDTLFYNWQYWRTNSYPINASDGVSVTFQGSFY